MLFITCFFVINLLILTATEICLGLYIMRTKWPLPSYNNPVFSVVTNTVKVLGLLHFGTVFQFWQNKCQQHNKYKTLSYKLHHTVQQMLHRQNTYLQKISHPNHMNIHEEMYEKSYQKTPKGEFIIGGWSLLLLLHSKVREKNAC
jgi:hypothetical protein